MSISPDLAPLSAADAERLLELARQTLAAVVQGKKSSAPHLADLSEPLRRPGASFVTLMTRGRLHGCIGSVEPRLPLALDVIKNAESAALYDPRFAPLRSTELKDTSIEISVLTPMQPVTFQGLDDLIDKVRPGVDGVLVERGWQRGLLLPQVWEQLPDPRRFLEHVALKAQASIDIYEMPGTEVYFFQVHSYEQGG